MKIISLDVKNVKRIRAVHVEPSGATVILGGRNGAGKTSVLDAITMALAGGKTIPGVPLRQGEKRGTVRVDLGEVVITRTFTEGGGGQLAVEAKVGDTVAQVRSPQAWLDARIGALSFDPLDFMRQKAGPQAETMRRLVGVDMTALDAERADVYARRTDENRRVRDAEGAVRDMPHYPAAPAEPITTEALTADLEAARRTNAAKVKAIAEHEEARRVADVLAREVDAIRGRGAVEIERERGAIARTEQDIARDRGYAAEAQLAAEREVSRIEALLVEARAAVEVAAGKVRAVDDGAEARREQARALVQTAEQRVAASVQEAERVAAEAEARARSLGDAAGALPVADEQAAIARFGEAERGNQQIAANKARAEAERRAESLRQAARALTERIDAIDADKARLLAGVQFPVPGLSFGEDGLVTLNGLPLGQASGAEQIRVSMAVALALNPTLRVVLIRDASLLDEDSLRMVAEMAAERDAQVWLERVGDGDESAVVIEDGCVREPAAESIGGLL